MKRGLPFLILFVLVVIAAAWWLTCSSRRPVSADVEAVSVERATRADSLIDDAAPPIASARQESPAVEAHRAPAIEQQPAHVRDASIRGRFVRRDGSPAVDVELSVASTTTRQMRASDTNLPPDATLVLGKSDATGAFFVKFAPVRHAAMELRAKLAGYGIEIWSWQSIEPGADLDIGEVRLRPEGIVRGRVFDKHGAGLEGWTVSATAGFVGENYKYISTARTAADGSYRLENLAPGAFEVFAMASNSDATKQVKVRVAPGQVIEVDFRYDGPPLARRIVVRPRFGRTTVFFQGDWIEMALLAPGSADRRPAVIRSIPMRFYLDDVLPGEYSIQLRDARFKPLTVEHVQPGAVVDLDIVGGAAIALTVVDDESGERIERFSVESRNESLYGRGTVCTLFDDKSASSGETVVEGVLTIDQTLIVRAPGRSPLEIPIRGLQQGERRALHARLTQGVLIEGVVIGSVSRKPVPSARVRLLKKLPDPKGQPWPSETTAGPRSIATTDAQGRFTISGVGLGEIEAAVTIDSLPEKRTPISITELGVIQVELEAPAAGRLVGRVLAPPGASFADLGLFIAHVEKNSDQKIVRQVGGRGARIEANGEFSTPWIEAGDAVVRLMQRRERTAVGDPSWFQNRVSPIELGTVTLASDADTRRDFDLLTAFPCAVDVYVMMGGGPAFGVDVELRDTTLDNRFWLAATDENGRARLPVVPPSTYFVLVREPESKWVWGDPRELRVDFGVTARHEAVVEVVDVDLSIRAGNPPAPLVSSRVILEPVGKTWNAAVMTDASGRALVKLQIGRWMVRKSGQGRTQTTKEVAEIEVRAAGPRTFVIDLVERPR